jgi:hypothetical protein
VSTNNIDSGAESGVIIPYVYGGIPGTATLTRGSETVVGTLEIPGYETQLNNVLDHNILESCSQYEGRQFGNLRMKNGKRRFFY